MNSPTSTSIRHADSTGNRLVGNRYEVARYGGLNKRSVVACLLLAAWIPLSLFGSSFHQVSEKLGWDVSCCGLSQQVDYYAFVENGVFSKTEAQAQIQAELDSLERSWDDSSSIPLPKNEAEFSGKSEGCQNCALCFASEKIGSSFYQSWVNQSNPLVVASINATSSNFFVSQQYATSSRGPPASC